MSSSAPIQGSVSWTDLTVDSAESVRDFYQSVVGWKSESVDMGGYSDFSMLDAGGTAVAGICHARGENSGLPPQWLIYVTVEDLTTSLDRCRQLGGAVINGPRDVGAARMAVIRDPAGAVCALYQPPADESDTDGE